VLAILGAGVEGRYHLEAIPRVREFSDILVANRTPGRAERLALEHPTARAVTSFEEAVREADVVCCCTDSAEPVLEYRWLRRGAHVNSIGANFEGPELDRDTVARGRLVVESRVAFQPPPAGCRELQGLSPDSAAELGEVLAAARPGRHDDDEITVYKSMGHGVEDAAAAQLVYKRAIRESVGTHLAL
jgi:ornithine cyclodeaminase/alanine dehydrogenase-like protein (mu-crystallin family)